jgi:hypothetical protein
MNKLETVVWSLALIMFMIVWPLLWVVKQLVAVTRTGVRGTSETAKQGSRSAA